MLTDRLPAAWALLSTLVRLALRLLERVRGGVIAERIAAAVLGAAWSLATLFVVPIIAIDGVGPIETLRRSARLIKARWGEGITGSAAIAVALFLIVSAAQNAVTQVFHLALYDYAAGDTSVSSVFSEDDLQSAMRPKKRLFGR